MSKGDGQAGAMTRRRFLTAAAGMGIPMLAPLPGWGQARGAGFTFGLTPVFLDSDVQLLKSLKRYLQERMRRPVVLVKKRTYQEITSMLLSGRLDAAWICGYPFVRYESRLSLVSLPVYNGKPLYQSYLIVNHKKQARSIADLRGDIHAFSDPDSNSGFLVTRALLARMGERPESFFSRYFYTYGHRNVIRAVASGLAYSGSVDGYVWDVMRDIDPKLTARTRVIRKSRWFGFPPVACRRELARDPVIADLKKALFTMNDDPLGREILASLRLDGFAPGRSELFDGIARLVDTVRDQV